ncbi:hypothetical protein ABZP36_033230 [Zizania latifolia]
MGRAPCCDKKGLKKGPWTPEEDKLLVDYIQANGHGSWRLLPKLAVVISAYYIDWRWWHLLSVDAGLLACRWSMIAAQLPGRTDNEIKNYWNTHLKKHLRRLGLDEPPPGPAAGCPTARHMPQWETSRLEAEKSLSLSSSGAAATTITNTTATTSASSSSTSGPVAATAATPADVFLRLWNSDIGDSFRKLSAAAAAGTGSPPPPVDATKDMVKQEAALPGDDSSAASNEVEAAEAMDEYQMFLDFAGEELGLFHGRYGGFSLFPPIDVLVEASLDTAFK